MEEETSPEYRALFVGRAILCVPVDVIAFERLRNLAQVPEPRVAGHSIRNIPVAMGVLRQRVSAHKVVVSL